MSAAGGLDAVTAHGVHHHGERHVGRDVALQIDIVGTGLGSNLLLHLLLQLAHNHIEGVHLLHDYRFLRSVAVPEGDKVVTAGLLAVAHHEGELAVGRRRHVDAYVHDARPALDKAGAVAVDGAVPVGVD